MSASRSSHDGPRGPGASTASSPATRSSRRSSPARRRGSRRRATRCRSASSAGGRLLAFGRGPYATDAQHVAVEFVHPVIVGKRALPALDLSLLFGPWLEALVRPDDMVMGFGPPEGDDEVRLALARAAGRRRHDLRAPGHGGLVRGRGGQPECVRPPGADRGPVPHALGDGARLLRAPRAGPRRRPVRVPLPVPRPRQAGAGGPRGSGGLVDPDEGGRRRGAPRAGWRASEAERIGAAILAIHERLRRGGKLIIFGNGGSATDANDWAIDCVAPPPGMRPVPAVSLAMEAATVTAIANDVGTDVVFLRQLIAHARAGRRGGGHLHQRRVPQRHRGAGRGAEARAADGGAAGVRRRRDPAAGAGRSLRRGGRRTTSRGSRRSRPRSITRCARAWRSSAMTTR